MAFWCRIKQSQLKSLSNQFKRCYFQIHGPCSFNSTASHTRIWVLDRPTLVFHKSQFEFGNNVRFFAAPVQVKPKQEEKNTSGPRLNEQISSLYVRLVSDEGHAIVSRHEALERARRLKLDLVEVQRSANPPVCKLMDYHREKYKQQLKVKDRSKSKSEVTLRKGDCKEVRFAGKIEKKDLQMKADMVKRLMERGYRVKCMAMGTEDQDLGGLLARLSALIEDVSVVESGPRMEKKQAYVIVRHVKFGPSKKGTSKKLSEVNVATSTNVQKVSVSPPNINPSTQRPSLFEENLNGTESGLETDDDVLSEEVPTSPSLEMPDEDLAKNKSTWSVLDASDDFDEVFDFRNDLNGVASPETSSSPKSIFFARAISTKPVLDFTRTPTSSPTPSESSLGIDNRYRREPRNRFPPPPTKQINVNPPDARDSRRLQTQFPNQRVHPNQRGHPQFDSSTLSPSGETKHGETDVSMVRNLKLPADEFSKKEPSRSGPSFGLFSAPEANSIPRKQSASTEVNRYKKGANPIRNSESQAKVQR